MGSADSMGADFYFGSKMPYCRAGNISAYIYNITSPYTDHTDKASIVGTSVAMFTLSVLFFNLTMFRQIGPRIRVARSTALSLFLPVMSYLFSEAKNAAGATVATSILNDVMPLELPMRARLILTWMILVELLRKKTEALWVPKIGYSGIAEQAARIAWLGSLVFSNIKSPGRRAVFGVLWTVAAAKMVQRFVIGQVIRHSFAAGRNPEIIGAFTQQIPEATCNEFAVMGEEKVEMKTGPRGYIVSNRHGTNSQGVVITVGKIWGQGDLPQEAKKLCLSFALHKLLRRRLEGPALAGDDEHDIETLACRDLIIDDCRDAEELFRVVANEANILRDCYHSVDPIVVASPFFLVANYILFPIAVGCVCLMTIVASGYGEVLETFHSIRTDNYVMSFGVVKTVVCLMQKVLFLASALLCAVDLCITFFLFVAYFYEELHEFVTVLLSDWFLVSLVCSYVKGAQQRSYHTVIPSSIRCILYVRRKFTESEQILRVKQIDLTKTAFVQMPVVLQQSPLPAAAKVSVINHITGCIQNGGNATLGHSMAWQYYSSAYMEESIAQGILTWHIATTLLEGKHPLANGATDDDRSTAMTLSQYCAYLVAIRPELVPNDLNESQHLSRTMARDLKKRLGCWGYYFFPKRVWLDRISNIVPGDTREMEEGRVVHKGVVLGEALESAMSCGELSWKVLAELWVELVVYIAPASDIGAHRQGHYAALVEGGEFITLLWALATHCGIKRPPVARTAARGAVDQDFRP